MTAKTRQAVHPYSVRIKTAAGKSTAVPLTLMTPKQVEEVQTEFKKLAQNAGVKGARIEVQRVSAAGDYQQLVREAKAVLRAAMGKVA